MPSLTKAKLAFIAILVAALIGPLGLGAAVYLRGETLNEACEAARSNNDILRDLVSHVEHRSIQSIKAGVTQDITVQQVRGFYQPTLRRIDAVQC